MPKLFVKLRITVGVIPNKKKKRIKNNNPINTPYIVNKSVYSIKSIVFKSVLNTIHIKVVQCIKCK